MALITRPPSRYILRLHQHVLYSFLVSLSLSLSFDFGRMFNVVRAFKSGSALFSLSRAAPALTAMPMLNPMSTISNTGVCRFLYDPEYDDPKVVKPSDRKGEVLRRTAQEIADETATFEQEFEEHEASGNDLFSLFEALSSKSSIG